MVDKITRYDLVSSKLFLEVDRGYFSEFILALFKNLKLNTHNIKGDASKRLRANRNRQIVEVIDSKLWFFMHSPMDTESGCSVYLKGERPEERGPICAKQKLPALLCPECPATAATVRWGHAAGYI